MFFSHIGGIGERKIEIGQTDMNYVVFGKGSKPFVIIPGLGDGFKTVQGTGLILSYIYRFLARDYRVYIFSRKNNLDKGCSTRDMAIDLASVMSVLNLKHSDVMGISQGGMIAQWLAIDYPDMVDKLALVITAARQNQVLQRVIASWIAMAEAELFGEQAVDTLEKSHTERYLKKMRPLYWLIRKAGRPVLKERFLIQAESCRTHDAYRELSKIKSPTLVLGGGADQIVGGAEVQREIAEAIHDSVLHIYPELGHGAYMEAPDFRERILSFFVK